MAKYFHKKVKKVFDVDISHILWVVLAIVVVKCLLGTIALFVVWYKKDFNFMKYQEKLLKHGKDKISNFDITPQSEPVGTSAAKAFKDIAKPFFIATWIVTGVFFYFVKSESTPYVWIMMRPLIIGFMIFFLFASYRWIESIRTRKARALKVWAYL